MKKALFLSAVALSLSAPALAADRGQGRGNDDGVIEIFENQGQCQSRLVQLRNSVRGITSVNVPGSVTALACRLITRGPLEGFVALVSE